jgi:hypothetical protein
MPQVTETPLPTPLPTETVMPGSTRYEDNTFEFAFQVPPGWTVNSLSPNVFRVTSPNVVLTVGVKHGGEMIRISRTGVGAGELVSNGTAQFLGEPVTRKDLIFEDKLKTVLYASAGEIERGELVFTLSLDYLGTDYEAVDISDEDVATAEAILASFSRLGKPPVDVRTLDLSYEVLPPQPESSDHYQLAVRHGEVQVALLDTGSQPGLCARAPDGGSIAYLYGEGDGRFSMKWVSLWQPEEVYTSETFIRTVTTPPSFSPASSHVMVFGACMDNRCSFYIAGGVLYGVEGQPGTLDAGYVWDSASGTRITGRIHMREDGKQAAFLTDDGAGNTQLVVLDLVKYPYSPVYQGPYPGGDAGLPDWVKGLDFSLPKPGQCET